MVDVYELCYILNTQLGNQLDSEIVYSGETDPSADL